MIGRIRKGWRLFESSEPGHRFRERYRRRLRSRRGSLDPARILYIVGGVTLIVASALIGWLPVFGWGTVALGLGMIAGEFRPAAHLMDWLEVRLRRIFRPVARAFRKLPPWAQLSASLVIALATFALVYGMYQTFSGG